MTLRSGADFTTSLRDGRVLFYRGERVADVTTHASLRRTVEHAAELFDMQQTEQPGLWWYDDEDLGPTSTFFLRPLGPDALTLRGDVIEESTRRARSTFNIIKAVGTDALLALEQVTAELDEAHHTDYAPRVSAFRRQCAREDLGLALAATDPKGDRTLPPSRQADGGAYLRIVDRDGTGITVSGAKLHTTASASANELIIIPCRAMTSADGDYAVAFATPLNAPGLTLIAHPLVDQPLPEIPVSGRNIEVETMTIFDHVHVPWARVFLCREAEFAGPIARAFANFHRFTAISYKPPLVDLLIGAAALAADQLGLIRSAAVREKLARLIVYGDLIRAARLAAAAKSRPVSGGLHAPEPRATNAGKFHFSAGFHQAVAMVQDIAGALTVTAPGIEDLDHASHGSQVDRYLAGREGVAGRERWEIAQLIRDLTASEWGGWNLVATLHGEGSQSAQLIEALRSVDLEAYVSYARAVTETSVSRGSNATVPIPSLSGFGARL